MSFASPDLTIPQVARILRPGGIFVFNVEHPVHAIAWDDAAQAPSRIVQHSYFDLDRIDDPLDDSVNFTRPISGYLELLRTSGFTLERLLEPRPEAGATTSYDKFADASWARDLPGELLIRARRA